LDVQLDRTMCDRLDRYVALLREVAAPRGMVARGDLDRLEERHILDSLRAAPLLEAAPTVCDLGSGSGLPGLVLAVVLPRARFTLAEPRRNRSSFLAEAVLELELANVAVHAGRAETVDGQFHVCTARALFPVAQAWKTAAPLLVPGGRLIYWAGERFDPTAVPDDAELQLFRSPALARSGALAMMSRQ
jgi:16S rRNA (guanine527-N7)-methyltransferase